MKFYISIKKSIDEFEIESQKTEFSMSSNQAFLDFSSNLNDYLSNMKKLFDLINKEIIENGENYLNNWNKKTLEKLTEFLKFTNFITENKKKLELSKNNYFDACKNTMDQENKVIKIVEKENTKNDLIKQSQEILHKFQDISLSNEKNYKNEILNMNKILEENENNYSNLFESLKKEDSNRINFIINLLSKNSQFIIDFSIVEKELIAKMDKISRDINLKRDQKTFENIFNHKIEIENNLFKRFTNEQFLDYEIFKKNNSDLIDNQNNNSTENSIILTEEEIKKLNLSKENSMDFIEIKKLQKEIDLLNKKDDANFQRIINDLINSPEAITNDELMYVINKIENNIEKSKIFLYYLLIYYQKDTFVKINCIFNLYHLSNFLLIIINNSQSGNFDLNFIMIYIAERTIFLNPENIFNKCYLCKLLSKNKIFQDKNFWNNLIEKKISTVADIKIKNEIDKKEQKKNLIDEKTMINKVKNLFNYNKKINENKKVENEIVYGQILQEKLPIFAVEVIEKYIQHFANFNYAQEDCILIINNLYEKYKFKEIYVEYFQAKLKSNLYTIKNQSDYFEKNDFNVDFEKLYFNFYKSKFKKIGNNIKLKCLVFSLPYLNFKEMVNLLCLNKENNKILTKIIYKNILLKKHDLSIKTHIAIWKILLNYTSTKKKFNYSEIKKKNEDTQRKIPSRDIIDLDVARTSFETNREEKRKKIANILKAISSESPKASYCQGMNYIAAFLLNVIENEEEVFYFFISLLESTEYGSLFYNDLAKLKKYFYVFERILNILVPELYEYLKNNNISTSYYVAPWFITLFTDSYPYVKNKENPKIVFRIWDLFVFSGWKNIIKIGISLLKNFEKKLLTLSYEDLLHFLITDIIKSEFFDNDNLKTLFFITINFKIESGLIESIENEYELKKKAPIGNQNSQLM